MSPGGTIGSEILVKIWDMDTWEHLEMKLEVVLWICFSRRTMFLFFEEKRFFNFFHRKIFRRQKLSSSFQWISLYWGGASLKPWFLRNSPKACVPRDTLILSRDDVFARNERLGSVAFQNIKKNETDNFQKSYGRSKLVPKSKIRRQSRDS